MVISKTASAELLPNKVLANMAAERSARHGDRERQDLARPAAESLPRPIEFRHEYTIEKDKTCQEELLALEPPPNHVFGNILDFVPKAVL